MRDPRWVLVRATIPLPNLRRSEIATVDLTDPYIKGLISATYLVPLPAAQQPTLRHDPETNGPQYAREGSDV